jgi:hypothetical protein
MNSALQDKPKTLNRKLAKALVLARTIDFIADRLLVLPGFEDSIPMQDTLSILRTRLKSIAREVAVYAMETYK